MNGKKIRLLTPENVTEADLIELKLTRAEFDQKVKDYLLAKALAPVDPKLRMPLFYIGFPLKSPCKARSPEWFANNKDRILEEANKALANRHQTKPFDQTYHYFDDNIRVAIFAQMVAVYQSLVESQSVHINIPNGCCSYSDRCIFPAFQRCLLIAMRHLESEARETEL